MKVNYEAEVEAMKKILVIFNDDSFSISGQSRILKYVIDALKDTVNAKIDEVDKAVQEIKNSQIELKEKIKMESGS